MTHLAHDSLTSPNQCDLFTRPEPQQRDIILGFVLGHLGRRSPFPTGLLRDCALNLELPGAFLNPPRERLPENEANTEESRAKG